MNNKRGQKFLSVFLIGIILLFVGAVGWAMLFNHSGFAQSVSSATDSTINAIGPFFRTLLGSTGDSNQDFLAILAFILVMIVVVSTLDSVNIFGDKGGHLVNFIVGTIVAIIGVRFMPNNLWASLTAPSSALVATILVGLPFLALFFMTMAMKKYSLANKVIWLIYSGFMAYLVATASFGVSGADARNWVYIIFTILGVGMLLFDSQVRKIVYQERVKASIASTKGGAALRQINDLKLKIEDYQKVVANDNSTVAEVEEAEKRIKNIEEKIAKLAGYKA